MSCPVRLNILLIWGVLQHLHERGFTGRDRKAYGLPSADTWSKKVTRGHKGPPRKRSDTETLRFRPAVFLTNADTEFKALPKQPSVVTGNTRLWGVQEG